MKLNRFQPGQLILKYNRCNEIKLDKFKVKWVGPYKICEVSNNGTIKPWTLDEKEVADVVNGSKLKINHERNKVPGENETRTNNPEAI